jgi:hypothetical protein
MITLLLVVLKPAGSLAFWLELAALAALLGMHTCYWILTHPVNNFWLKNSDLKEITAAFFSFDPLSLAGRTGNLDWTRLRDRWELSHVVRAGFGLASLILLVTAIAV